MPLKAERLGGLMPKIRVHELANELNVESKDIIKKLGETGKTITSLSSLDESDVLRLRGELKKEQKKGEDKQPQQKSVEESTQTEQKPQQKMVGEDKPPKATEVDNKAPQQKPVGENISSPRSKPVDEDGKPLPPRQRPLGPDGKPLPPRPRLGPDGKPLPPRQRPLGPDGKPLPPRPRLDADGKPLRPRANTDEATSTPANTNDKVDTKISDLKPESGTTPPISATQTPQQEPVNTTPAAPLALGVISDSSGVAKPVVPPQSSTVPPARTIRRPEARPNSETSKDVRPQGQSGHNRSGGSRSQGQGGYNRDGQPRPQGQGSYGNRPAGGSRPQGQGGYGNRPASAGGPRPQGQGGFGNKPSGGAGRPQGNFAAGGAGRGKDDKKVAEPTKDDKRQQWRNQQLHSAKNKDDKRKDKENRQALDRRSGKRPGAKKIMPKRIEPSVTLITVAPEITVRDLAEKLHRSNADIIKVLMKKGVMVTANQTVDFETAVHVAESFNVLVEEYVEVDVFEAAFSSTTDEESQLESRPPVVVVMGHVDHGKTSLLDVIRSANVQKSEAGGITQHIGAYSVTINDKQITFLDTPGHEAFTAMRMRGAQITDIAILVVAADDGVMPQTVEAISHAKAAGVEIIVAVTMIDKPNANIDKVKQQLATHGLQSEDWGGTTITVPVSSREKIGIEQLLEMILLAAEMKELRANPNKPAKGSIIEAKLDKGRGPVATVLVQEGTLKVGDPVVAGACYGKVRAMTNSLGQNVTTARPSMPVEIIGLAEVPMTGDILYAAVNEKQARQLSETVVAKGRVSMIKSTQKVSLDDLFSQIQAGQVKDLNIVVKADVQGSVEALRGSLEKLSNDAVRVRIIHTGVGAVTESDVMLASASNAIIIGFNVRPDVSAKSVAESENVDVRFYSVIYSAIDDVEAAMKGMLDPEFEEKIMGHAEIRQIFKASSVGTIGGSYITEGRITRNAQVRIVRDGRVIYDGTLEALRRFKDDVREVAAGYECGILFKNYSDIKEGDRVEAYSMEEIPR